MTYLVFDTKVIADTVMNEIAVTPFGQVWCYCEPDATNNQIQYAQDANGKCMAAHNFSDEDRGWLEAYTAGMVGVRVLDAVPSDWVYPVNNLR